MRRLVASLVVIAMAAVILVAAIEAPASAAPASPYDPTWAPTSPVPGVSFRGSADTWVEASDIAVLPDGRVLANMAPSAIAPQPSRLIRYSTTGAADPTFTPIDLGMISASNGTIAIDHQGRILALASGELRRYLPTGLIDAAFTPIGVYTGTTSNLPVIFGIAIDSADRVVVSARVRGNDNVQRGYVIRYTSEGAVAALRSDGTVAIAGEASGDRAAIAMLAAPQALTPEPPTVPAATGAGFNPVGPHRILDTRTGTGAPAGKAQPATPIHLDVTGHHAIPDTGVSAVTINITVNDPDTAGYATIYPCNIATPDASSLNYSAHDTIPNLVTVPVAPDGTICLYTYAPAHLIGDIAGWYGSQ
jgi:hypothetical protein